MDHQVLHHIDIAPDPAPVAERTPKRERKTNRDVPHKQPTTGHDPGLYPRRGPFEILQRESGDKRAKYWLVGALDKVKPPDDWQTYLAERFGSGTFLVWWMPTDHTKQHGRIIVPQSIADRARAKTNPPDHDDAPDEYDDDEGQDDEGEEEDDLNALERQLDTFDRIKSLSARLNPPPVVPPAPTPSPLLELARILTPMLAPIVAQQMQKSAASTQAPAMAPPAPSSPTPPPGDRGPADDIDPEWTDAIDALRARGLTPGKVKAILASQPPMPPMPGNG